LATIDIEICGKIGQLLYDAAPEGAVTIIMRAELLGDGDVVKFQFDAIDETGKVSWFTSKGAVKAALHDLLLEHRAFFVSQNQPPWSACEFSLFVPSDRLSLKLHYK